MYKNYENRVKNFILDMTNPDTKIIINDLTKNMNKSPKESFYEIKNRKPFIFKGYRNEIDRIKNTIRDNQFLYNYPDYPDYKKIKSLSPRNNKVNSRSINNIINDENVNINNSKIKKERKDNPLNSSLELFNKSKYSFSPLTRNLSKYKKQKYDYYIKNDIILQPLMRFKPRTDLERIYDELNGQYLFKDEKNIIKRQLKNINLYDYKKPNDLFIKKRNIENNKYNNLKNNTNGYKILSDRETENKKNFSKTKSQSEILDYQNKLYYKRNKNIDQLKPWIRFSDLNIEATDLLKSYHYKTHFKATEEIAEKIINKNIKNTGPKGFNKNMTFNFSDGNLDNPEVFDKDLEYIENTLNKIPKKKIGQKLYNNESFKTIRKLAFKRESSFDLFNNDYNINNNDINKKNKKNSNYLLDENNLFFDNKIYNKKKQFDLIAKKVLKLCNVHSDKSKFNNSSLKEKSGKTMITQGLSVEQFEKKYGLKE